MRSAYRMMIEVKKSREDYFEGQTSCSDVEKRQREWKQLWKMELLPKIKKFCWRLALSLQIPRNRSWKWKMELA